MKFIIHNRRGYWRAAGRGYTTDVLDAGMFAADDPHVRQVERATLTESRVVDARSSVREALATALERGEHDGRIYAIAALLVTIRNVSETLAVTGATADDEDCDPIRPMLAAVRGGAVERLPTLATDAPCAMDGLDYPDGAA